MGWYTVEVTGNDMTDDFSLGEVVRSIRRIEDKLDSRVTDHETRLRAVERWMWGLAGIAGGGLASGITALVQTLSRR